MAIDVGLRTGACATPPVVRTVWLMAKVLVVAATVTEAVAVEPTAEAVKVALPIAPDTPATVVVNLPLASVKPDAGVSVT